VVISILESDMRNDLAPQLLALDWGTSSLRAFLMQDAKVVDTRQSGHGIQHLPVAGSNGFEQAFAGIAGDWVRQWPSLPIVASGMVGSAQGWREAPYVRCPADITVLAQSHVTVPSGLGPDIAIAPGVLFDEPGQLPDVMRGEEIQIAGALSENRQWAARCCIVHPGTHSKWVQVEAGKILRFTTYMTGELFAVLCQHSILGRLMPQQREAKPEPDLVAFELGLAEAKRGRPGDVTHQIFGTRTLGLTARLPHASLADYLSGLLIGNELVSGLAHAQELTAAPLVMIGEPALCQRYAHAFTYFGHPTATVLDNTAPIGLWNFAVAAGLLGEAVSFLSED
jgi:2-dehydro-3-deoxygalactonokinase